MSKLPKRFVAFMEKYPKIGRAYSELGDAVADAGPLDAKSRALVKLGLAIGAGLALTTIGFPSMMKGLGLVEDVIAESESHGRTA